MTATISDKLAAAFASVAEGRFLDALEAHGHDVTDVREAAERVARRIRDPELVVIHWLTVEQAAVNLRVDVRTVRRWCASGRLVGQQQSGERGVWMVDPCSVARALLPCPRDGHGVVA